MKSDECGLVVGKFSPLHFGHEAVIRRALEECAEVILISYSKPEYPGCDAVEREKWLRTRFPSARIWVMTDERLQTCPELYPEWTSIPANGDPGKLHERFCAEICEKVLRRRVDVVYCSEDYGESFARTLTEYYRTGDRADRVVRAVLVDRERVYIPISGTLLRSDHKALKRWVAPVVYASFVRRICLLGGESTGKSTLAKSLADRFQTNFAPEFGRELWEERGGALKYEDLLVIAEKQVHREQQLAASSNQLLFCDTSPLTTYFYSLDLFGQADPALIELSRRTYDLTVLCADDFPFVQDGTRRDTDFRTQQQAWYRRELALRGIEYVEVTGAIEQRSSQVEAALGRAQLLQ